MLFPSAGCHSDGLNVTAHIIFLCASERSNHLFRGRGLSAYRAGRKPQLCVQFHPIGMIADIRAD